MNAPEFVIVDEGPRLCVWLVVSGVDDNNASNYCEIREDHRGTTCSFTATHTALTMRLSGPLSLLDADFA